MTVNNPETPSPEDVYNSVVGEEPSQAEREQAGEPTYESQSQEQDQTQEQSQEQEAPKDNPAWDEAWKDVPAPIREQQREVFRKWDENHRGIEERYQRWEPYEARGVEPEHVDLALTLQDALFSDPQNFVTSIAQEFGITIGEAQQVAQAVADNAQAPGDNPYASDAERQLAELQAQQAAAQVQWQQQQQEARQQQYQDLREQQARKGNETQFTNLERRVGRLSDEDKVEIAQRAFTLAQTTGTAPNLGAAFQQREQERQRWAQQAGANAPRVLGAGGNAPHNRPAADIKTPETDEERLEAAMALARSMAEG